MLAIRGAVMIALAVALLGCRGTDSATGQAPSATSEDQLGRPTAPVADDVVRRRLAQLRDFRADDRFAGEQCGDLSASNGTVQLDASRSLLSRTLQNSTTVRREDLELVVNFGSEFPSFTCTDVESEMQVAVVDESWSATARSALFTVTQSNRCSVAKLELFGVEVMASNGETVELGTMSITNQAWQWWHPFECQLELVDDVVRDSSP